MYTLKTKGKITYYSRRRDLVRDYIVDLISRMMTFKQHDNNAS